MTETKLIDAQVKSENYRNQNEQLREQLSQLSNSNTSNENQKDNGQTVILRSKVTELENSIKSLQNQNSLLETNIKEMDQQINKKDLDLKEQKKVENKLNEQLKIFSDLNNQVKVQVQEIEDTMTQKTQEMSSRINEKEDEMQSLESKVQKLQSMISQKDSEIEKYISQIKNSNEEIQEKSKQIDDLNESRLQTEKEQHNSWKSFVEKIQQIFSKSTIPCEIDFSYLSVGNEDESNEKQKTSKLSQLLKDIYAFLETKIFPKLEELNEILLELEDSKETKLEESQQATKIDQEVQVAPFEIDIDLIKKFSLSKDEDEQQEILCDHIKELEQSLQFKSEEFESLKKEHHELCNTLVDQMDDETHQLIKDVLYHFKDQEICELNDTLHEKDEEINDLTEQYSKVLSRNRELAVRVKKLEQRLENQKVTKNQPNNSQREMSSIIPFKNIKNVQNIQNIQNVQNEIPKKKNPQNQIFKPKTLRFTKFGSIGLGLKRTTNLGQPMRIKRTISESENERDNKKEQKPQKEDDDENISFSENIPKRSHSDNNDKLFKEESNDLSLFDSKRTKIIN
ncbi:ciliary rootlet coiled-coil rootletin family member 2-related [Anaeramoeba ignava]|uniref:Ciliary rootlet coiled-coil rootletin family member 2-related n=1 Tax=Anaeramoeba ignava TaxID=1746090 RepID=A0A9Q0L6T3_ANAIG|nr:ciliary rootlet coiled-coil rootletin family member 2-related [Anaeramoeba ignava]